VRALSDLLVFVRINKIASAAHAFAEVALPSMRTVRDF